MPVTMLDASRGGFKLRLAVDPVVEAVLTPPPVDIDVIDSYDMTYGATVMWLKDGLVGCRFHQHQSLDAVAVLMTRSFRLTPARKG